MNMTSTTKNGNAHDFCRQSKMAKCQRFSWIEGVYYKNIFLVIFTLYCTICSMMSLHKGTCMCYYLDQKYIQENKEEVIRYQKSTSIENPTVEE